MESLNYEKPDTRCFLLIPSIVFGCEQIPDELDIDRAMFKIEAPKKRTEWIKIHLATFIQLCNEDTL
jgi:hypothetical protein